MADDYNDTDRRGAAHEVVAYDHAPSYRAFSFTDPDDRQFVTVDLE